MENLEKLKKCPFCGSKDNVYLTYYQLHSCDFHHNVIVCDKCNIRFETNDETNKLELIQKWNKRQVKGVKVEVE